MSVGPAGDYKYFAFISYSHKDKDHARWLHRKLETYRVPRRLVGRETPLGRVGARLYPIFRDTDELPTSADLSTNIKEALARSRHLIVVCSPSAAASRWVDEEIRSFKQLGRENRILGLIVNGEPNASDKPGQAGAECFPRSLRFALTPAGEPTEQRIEPLAADVRPEQDGRGVAKLKLVAGLTGLPFNELRRRDRQRVVRRRIQAAAAAFAVLGGVGAVWFQGYRERQAQAWEEARQQAVLIAQVAQTQARAWQTRAAAELALRALPQRPDRSDRPFTREAYAALHRALALDAQIRRLRGHTGTVLSVGFNPDGKRLVTGSGDKTARVWDIATGRTLLVLTGHQDVVTTAVFSPDGSRVLTSGDRNGYLWDAKTGERLALLSGHTRPVQRSAFSPDGRIVATAGWDDTVRLWDTASGKLLRVLKGGVVGRGGRAGDPIANAVIGATARIFGSMGQLAFSPDGRRLATAGAGDPDAAIRVWDTGSGELVWTLRGHDIGVRSGIDRIAFSPDGGRLVSASRDGTARLWNVATGTEMAALRGHAETVVAAAFSPEGTRVLTASGDGTARLWDGVTGEPLATLFGHSGGIMDAAFSPDGRRIATIARDNTIRIWEGTSGTPLAVLAGHGSLILALAFSADGAQLATTSRDNTAILWDASVRMRSIAFAPGARSSGIERSPAKAYLSRDGGRIVTAIKGTVRLWDTEAGGHVAVLVPKNFRDGKLTFDAVGRLLLIRPDSGDPEVWDTLRGRRIAQLNAAATIADAALSDDGARAATIDADGRVRVWDAKTGRTAEVFRAEPPTDKDYAYFAVWFAPGAPLLAASACTSHCRIFHWHIVERRMAFTLEADKAHARDFQRAEFATALYAGGGTRLVLHDRAGKPRLHATDDGRAIAQLASAAWKAPFGRAFTVDPSGRFVVVIDGGARSSTIWDAQSGLVRHTVEGLFDAFSPDGSLVAAASWGELRIYDAHSGTLRFVIQDRRIGSQVLFVPGKPRLVVHNGFGTEAVLVDIERGAIVAELRAGSERRDNRLDTDEKRHIAVSADGTLLAGLGNDGRARLWSAQDGSEVAVLGSDAADWITFAAGTSRLAIADEHGVGLWDPVGRARVALLRAATELEDERKSAFQGEKSFVFLDRNRRIFVKADFGGSGLFEVETGEPAPIWWGTGITVAVSPDKRRVYVEGFGERMGDRSGEIWDVVTRRRIAQLPLGAEPRTSFASKTASPVFSPDGRRLAVFLREAVLIDAEAGKILKRLEGHKESVQAAAFSRDGRRLATGSADKTLRVWNADTGAPELTLEGFAGALTHVEFSADGTMLMTVDAANAVEIWHVPGRKRIGRIPYGAELRAAHFNADGTRFLILGTLWSRAALWRMPEPPGTGIPDGTSHLIALAAHTDEVVHAAFSPEGGRLLTASRDGTARLHDAKTGRPLALLRGHAGAVIHAAFSPDATRVVTSGEDKTVRIWDAASGAELSMFNGLRGPANRVAFTPDGAGVVIAGASDPVQIWRVAPPHWPAMKDPADLVRYARGLLSPPRLRLLSAAAPVHDCDRLAGNPFAKDKLAPGVRWDRFDPFPAIERCRAAAAQHPGVVRFRFLYARSLLKAGEFHRALPALEQLAELDLPEALTALGLMYAAGLGVEPNLGYAAQLYERASAAGDKNGQHNFAHALLYGRGVARDDARALALLRALAEEGLPNSQYLLGVLYRDGHAVPKTPALAREWMEKAAAQDYADADYVLALIHWFGEGTEKDRGRALHHLRRAAERGSLRALYDLGLLHAEGNAVERDPAKAVRYLEQSATRGHADAQLALSRALARGFGIARDLEKAYFWSLLAASSGDDAAKKHRDQLRGQLDEDPRRIAETAAWRWRPRP